MHPTTLTLFVKIIGSRVTTAVTVNEQPDGYMLLEPCDLYSTLQLSIMTKGI